jgi:hypothetical protein
MNGDRIVQARGRAQVRYSSGAVIALNRSNYDDTFYGVQRYDLPQRGMELRSLTLEFIDEESMAPAHAVELKKRDIDRLLASARAGFELVIFEQEPGRFERYTYPYESGPFRTYYRLIRDGATPGPGDAPPAGPMAPGELARPAESVLLSAAHYEELLKRFERNEFAAPQLEAVVRTQLLWTFEEFQAAEERARDRDPEIARKIHFYRSQFETLGKIALRIGAVARGEPFAQKLKLYRDAVVPVTERTALEIADAFFPDPTKLDAADQEKLYPELSKRNAGPRAVAVAKYLYKETSDRSVRALVGHLKNLATPRQQDQFLTEAPEANAFTFEDLKLVARTAPEAGAGIYSLYRRSVPSAPVADLVPLIRLLKREGNHVFLTQYLTAQRNIPFNDFVAVCGAAAYYGSEHYLVTFRQKIAEKDAGTTIRLAKLLSRDANHAVLNDYLAAQSSVPFQELLALADAANYYGRDHYLLTYRQKIAEKDVRTAIALAGQLSRDANHTVLKEFLDRQERIAYADLVAVANAANYYGKDHYLLTYRQKIAEKDLQTAIALAGQLSRDANHAVVKEFLDRQERISFADLVAAANAANYYGKDHYLFTYRQKIADRNLSNTIALARMLSRESNHTVIMEYITANPNLLRSDLEQLAGAANYYGRDHYLQLRR